MNLEDLHPLIAGVADEPWSRQDYAGAVEAAWFELRDVLRDKLDSSSDVVQLVNEISEKDPRLLLTDYASETDQSMHRGIVNLLRGVAYYVRNPMAHGGTGPPGGNDPARCFEYLAVMSICARHVVRAIQPTTVVSIIGEASQRRFSSQKEAVADLVDALPAARLPDLVAGLIEAFQDALRQGDEDLSWRMLTVYFHALGRAGADSPAVKRASRICARLLAADETFDVGVDLLEPHVFQALPARHRSNAAHAMVGDLRSGQISGGAITNGGRYRYSLTRVFGDLGPRDRRAVLYAIVRALKDRDADASAYALRTLMTIGRHLTAAEYPELADGVALSAMLCRKGDDVFQETRRVFLLASDDFARVLEVALARRLSRLKSNVEALPGSPRVRKPGAESLFSFLHASMTTRAADP